MRAARRGRYRLGQAESSSRPLRRRADRMARPARVRIRRRKPWTFARRRLFGWKVRLLNVISKVRNAGLLAQPVVTGQHRVVELRPAANVSCLPSQ